MRATFTITQLTLRDRVLRWLTAAMAGVPFIAGAGLLVWAFAWPRDVDRTPAGWGDTTGFFAATVGAVYLLVAVVYGLLTAALWRRRWWSVAALMICASAQFAFQASSLLRDFTHPMRHGPRGSLMESAVECLTNLHAVLALLTALACAAALWLAAASRRDRAALSHRGTSVT